MPHPSKDSHLAKRRVADSLDLLHRALVKYLTALPRTSRTAYGGADLQALLKAFIDRFAASVLPSRVKNLAFAAKDARNDVAHYIGVMTPDDALRHLSNIGQLLKDLDAASAFGEMDSLYQAQLDSMRPGEKSAPAVAEVAEDTSRADDEALARSHGEQADAYSASAGLIHFAGDDGAYFDWLVRHPKGFVVNVRKTLSDDYVVLHLATCAHISAPREPGAYTERSYHKLCGPTLADVLRAPMYCGRASGSFTKRCAHCDP